MDYIHILNFIKLMDQPTIIRDTIYKTIEKVTAAKIDNVEIYKEILNSQTATYNLIMYFFLGIIALFAGATWLYNRYIAKSEIIKQTDKIFAKEKEKLITEFKKEFEIELAYMKGDSARLFAIASKGDEPSEILNCLHWWVQCIKLYNQADKGHAVRLSCESAIDVLEKVILRKEEVKLILLDTYNEVNFTVDIFYFDIYKNIPSELLIEREKLIKMTKQLLE